MTSPDREFVHLEPTISFLGKDIFPIGFGMTRIAAEENQDKTTKAFAPNHDNDASHLSQILTGYHLGYNVFDTAAVYGDSEVLLGQALQEMERDEVVVITKVGIIPDDNIIESMERSAERLGTIPDVTALHTRYEGEEEKMYDSIAQFNRGVERGFAKAMAVCNLQPHEYLEVIKLSKGPIAFYQAKLNLYHPRGDAPQTLDISREHKIPHMASAAFDNGKYFTDKFKEERPETAALVDALSKKYDMTPAQIALFATRSLGTIPIVESSNPKRMDENARTINHVMERGDVRKLHKILLGETI